MAKKVTIAVLVFLGLAAVNTKDNDIDEIQTKDAMAMNFNNLEDITEDPSYLNSFDSSSQRSLLWGKSWSKSGGWNKNGGSDSSSNKGGRSYGKSHSKSGWNKNGNYGGSSSDSNNKKGWTWTKKDGSYGKNNNNKNNKYYPTPRPTRPTKKYYPTPRPTKSWSRPTPRPTKKQSPVPKPTPRPTKTRSGRKDSSDSSNGRKGSKRGRGSSSDSSNGGRKGGKRGGSGSDSSSDNRRGKGGKRGGRGSDSSSDNNNNKGRKPTPRPTKRQFTPYPTKRSPTPRPTKRMNPTPRPTRYSNKGGKSSDSSSSNNNKGGKNKRGSGSDSSSGGRRKRGSGSSDSSDSSSGGKRGNKRGYSSDSSSGGRKGKRRSSSDSSDSSNGKGGKRTPRPTKRSPVSPPTPKPTRRSPTPRPTKRLPRPTPRPTRRPNPRPTKRPTPRPTRRPNPRPTPRPTRRSTPRPTRRPPTPRPTRRPNPRPTPRPTNMPTGKPTDKPTDEPTDKPTDTPTPEPTSEFCEELEEFRSDIVILIDNGCAVSSDICLIQNEFLENLLENIYAPQSRVAILKYNTNVESTGIEFGILSNFVELRENALELVNDIECNESGQDGDTNILPGIEGVIEYFQNNSPNNVQRRLILVSYCDATDIANDDDVCEEFEDTLENENIEVFVLNLGNDISPNEYICLTPDDNPNDSIDSVNPIDENELEEVIDRIVEQVCTEPEEDTDSPTDQPTDEPTDQPTDKPTNSPTDEPTEKPTNNPTDPPTDVITNSPTDEPTDKPTGMPTLEPTEEFCEELEEIRSDVLILVDNGCVIDEDVCDVQNEFLSSLVERVFAPSARVSIVSYNSELEFTGIDFGDLDDFESERENALEIIPSIVCNEGPMVFPTAVKPALEGAIEIFEDNTPEGAERRLVFISYCDATDLDDNDDVCDEFEEALEEANIITYIVNLGDQIESDAYECLTPDFAPNDFIDNVDPVDLDVLVPGVRERLVTQICDEFSPEPTEQPTDQPTDNPTPMPVDPLTPSPTDQPTDEPTDQPTPKPTDSPTDQPTDNPTEKPTLMPIDDSTPNPTDQPTDEPTDQPTDEPTEKPTTPSPTFRPTDEFCPELEDDRADVVILVDNGCAVGPGPDVCDAQNEFLSRLIEQIFAPAVRLQVFTFNAGLQSTGIAFGNLNNFEEERQKALIQIQNLQCNEGEDDGFTNTQIALNEIINFFNNNSPRDVERRLILLSYCEPTDVSDPDDICDRFENRLEDNNIDVFVLNLGDKVDDEQFICLTPDENPRDSIDSVDPVDEEVLVEDVVPGIVDQVCSFPTPGPTSAPVRTPRPTRNPTDRVEPTPRPTRNPTDRRDPTPRPTRNPTDRVEPTPRPTRNPTDRVIPTPKPTFRPTEDFCPELEDDPADIVILVDNGCAITGEVCDIQNEFLGSLIERIYAPSARVTVFNLNAGLTSTSITFGNNFEQDRINALIQIENLRCNEGQNDGFTNLQIGLNEIINYFNNNSPRGVERRLILLSYCEATDVSNPDDICDRFENRLEEQGIDVFVLNLGDKIDSNTYICLTPDEDPNDSIDSVNPVDLDVLIDDVRERIVDEVCSFPTPKPTFAPVRTPRPTREPTDRKDPTPRPTRNPTDRTRPTPRPTKQPTDRRNPTPRPTNQPTDRDSPTPKPTKKPIKSSDPFECPMECSKYPCPCDENPYCSRETCKHSNGCDQCMDDYWKLGYGYPCEECKLIPNCQKCTDFDGCQTCEPGYERIQSDTCIGDYGSGIYYCEQIICEPYINLRDTGVGQWIKSSSSNNQRFDYSGKYVYTSQDGFVFWLREDGAYIMKIDKLDDGNYYYIIGDVFDTDGTSNIYYYLDITMWNEYENPTTSRDNSKSPEWKCLIDDYNDCYVSSGVFEIMDCNGGQWTFCDRENDDLSNFPEFIDCKDGSAYVNMPVKSNGNSKNVYGIIGLVLSLTFVIIWN